MKSTSVSQVSGTGGRSWKWCVLTVVLALPGLALRAAEPKTVLFIEPVDPATTSLGEFLGGFRAELARQGAAANVFLEYIASGDENRPELADWLRKKYERRPIALIVALERSRTDQAITCRDRLWPGAPLLITGVDAARGRELGGFPNVTAVTVEPDIKAVLESAWRLSPRARSLVFVSGIWHPEKSERDLWSKGAAEFAAGRMEWVDLTGLAPAIVAERLRAQPAPAIVFLRKALTEGLTMTPGRTAKMKQFIEAAPGPVFSVGGNDSGDGAVATVSVNFSHLGEETGAQAAAIFRAGSASAVPVVASSALETVYDWRAMERWTLDARRLPPGSDVRFRPPGLWEAHPWGMAALATTIAALAGLVAVLLVQRRSRRREEEALHRQREEFSRTLRAATVSRLATSLAHELNQPLTALVTNADAGRRSLEKGDADPAKLVDILEDIAHDAQRAGDVIHSVRHMVCREQSVRRAVPVNEVVAGARRAILAEAKARDCAVVEELASGLPPVEVDAVQLQQVLLNLVLNAFDAMDAPGATARRVEMQTVADGKDAVCLSVRDFGAGLPPEGAEKWFEQFFTTKPGGMGMGLAIAREIVEAHGGTLTAENAEGGGTRLNIRLPAASVAGS